jgi:hypothetical protein
MMIHDDSELHFLFRFSFFWLERKRIIRQDRLGTKRKKTNSNQNGMWRFVSFRFVWFGLVSFRLCSLCTHQGSDAALIDIEILSSDSGAPVVEMHGYAAEVMRVVRFIPSLVSLVAVSSHACLAAASSPRASHRVRIA